MRCVATQKIGPPSSVERPANGEEIFDHLRHLVRPVRVQPVIAHADAEADADPVEERGQRHRRPRKVEQRGDGSDVKRRMATKVIQLITL